MLREWLDKIEVHIDDIYKRMYNKKTPPFRLMRLTKDGSDKEIEQNILEIEHDRFGKSMQYQLMDKERSYLFIDQLENFKYMPDELRALHYQIICANHDMITLKEMVGKALAKSEDMLLENFIKDNPSFSKISIDGW